MKTTDDRTITVELDGHNRLVFVKGRKVLDLPEGAATDLADALEGKQWGSAHVSVTEDAQLVSLQKVNDVVSILKSDRKVLTIEAGLCATLAMMLRADPGVLKRIDDFLGDPGKGVKLKRPKDTATTGSAGGASPKGSHRSNSQLTTYSDCGYRYYLERRADGIEQRPNLAAIAGSALHKMADGFEKRVFHFENKTPGTNVAWPDVDWATTVFLKQFDHMIKEESAKLYGTEWADPNSWSVAQKGKEDIGWWFLNGQDFAANFARANQPDRPFSIARDSRGAPMIEYEIDEALLFHVCVKGIIDRVTVTEDGFVDIEDLKSGAQLPFDRGFQVLSYAHVVKKLHPDWKIRAGAYWDFRTSTKKRYYLDDADAWTVEQIAFRMSAMDKMESAGVYLPTTGRHCLWCGVRKHCEYKGGQ